MHKSLEIYPAYIISYENWGVTASGNHHPLPTLTLTNSNDGND
jgi:hypothetical protein